MPYRDFTESLDDDAVLTFKLGRKGREREFEIEKDIPSSIMLKVISGGLRPETLDNPTAMKLGIEVLQEMLGPEDWNWILQNTGRTQLLQFMSWFTEEIFGAEPEPDEGGEGEEGKENSPEPEEIASELLTETSLPTGQPSNLIARNFGIVDPAKSGLSDSAAS